jgi:hypothetical protein
MVCSIAAEAVPSGTFMNFTPARSRAMRLISSRRLAVPPRSCPLPWYSSTAIGMPLRLVIRRSQRSIFAELQ